MAGASRSKTNFDAYSMSFKDTANFKVSPAPSEDLRHQTFTIPPTSRLLTSHSSPQKPTTVVWFWPGLQTVGWHYYIESETKHPKPLTLKALILSPKHPKP